MSLSRWPDAPILSTPAIFDTLKPGQHLCQCKLDGFRCITRRTPAGWLFTSRHNKSLPVSRALSEQLARDLAHLPVGTEFDGEWLARRSGLGNEQLVFFDVMSHGAAWVGSRPAIERFELLKTLVPSELVVRCTLSDYAAFFEATKSDPLAEGVVLKHVASRFIGSTRKSATNPGWWKVRFRAGAAGDRMVA